MARHWSNNEVKAAVDAYKSGLNSKGIARAIKGISRADRSQHAVIHKLGNMGYRFRTHDRQMMNSLTVQITSAQSEMLTKLATCREMTLSETIRSLIVESAASDVPIKATNLEG